MITSEIAPPLGRIEPVTRCPICNAGIGEAAGDWSDYVCGARVIASPHGSWSLSIPCPADAEAPI
ncbi:MAG: hypothetical protein NW206_12490 [Hyphomonadaceae bacterium]|nr:hypothetical protein [Hyphomonadaceae bacterium]